MENASYGLVQVFLDGGFMMYFLLLASLLGLGVIIAKAYVLWAAGRSTKTVLDTVSDYARQGQVDEALAYAERTPGPVAAIVLAGLNRVRESRTSQDIEQAMATTGKIELGFLERGMVVLATVATVAPLLGFLGTVWGMIEAFAAIEIAGQVEATLVAAGIKIALITTAAGLVIAIPINIMYNIFVTRIDKLIIEMETATSTVMNLVWDVFNLPAAVTTGADRPNRANMVTTAHSTVTNERPLGFDTQGTIVPDKDTMKSDHHRTLD